MRRISSGILVLSLASIGFPVVFADEPRTIVSWLGNSFPGTDGKWVQNFFLDANVRPDGTVITRSHWDEGGKKFGQYRDGDVVGDRDEHANSLQATDTRGHRWTIAIRELDPRHNEYDFEPEGIRVDGRAVALPGLHQPTTLAIAKDGLLMVADSGTGPRQQVLFYDVTDIEAPRLVREFGDRGGISAGVPGVVTPTKFWGIRGVGMDAQGNLYVAQSEMGTVLRSFTPEGKLRWELYDHFFVDLVSADPATDGDDVWGIQEHYRMDYRQPPGREAKWVGYSLDRHKYPNDPRGLTFVKQQGEHGLTSPQVVWLEGKRFLFVGGMFASNFITIFRYEGEIAIPSGVIMQWDGPLYRTDRTWPPKRPPGPFLWRDLNGDGDFQPNEYAPNTSRVRPGPFHVDSSGDIWMAHGAFRYRFQGIDPRGNPTYDADHVTPWNPPEGVKAPTRVWHDAATDTLVVAEQGLDEQGRPDMRHIGRVFIQRTDPDGKPRVVSFRSGAAEEAGCMAVAGNYVFTGGWKARGRIWINRLDDGTAVGVLDPGPTVGGVENTGWIDLMTGISAHRRKDGEYLVFVEEDYKGKVLLYRWRP
jgi:hypothetical protein